MIALISKWLFLNNTYKLHSLFKHNTKQAYQLRGTRVKGMQKERRENEVVKRNNETEPDIGMGNSDCKIYIMASTDIMLYINL